jgi:hypothetical protein
MKVGRPSQGETRAGRHVVTFRADDETIAAIDELEAAITSSGVVMKNRRSIVIRQVLLEARARLHAKRAERKR